MASSPTPCTPSPSTGARPCDDRPDTVPLVEFDIGDSAASLGSGCTPFHRSTLIGASIPAALSPRRPARTLLPQPAPARPRRPSSAAVTAEAGCWRCCRSGRTGASRSLTLTGGSCSSPRETVGSAALHGTYAASLAVVALPALDGPLQDPRAHGAEHLPPASTSRRLGPWPCVPALTSTWSSFGRTSAARTARVAQRPRRRGGRRRRQAGA